MTEISSAPVLYSFRRCPYAMRARMALQVSGIEVRLREILLKDKPEEMLRASTKGTVPVLVDSDHVIDESLDVMHWALNQNDPENWLPYDNNALALIEENDGSFKHNLDRYKYATRYDDADPIFHRTNGASFIEKLERNLQSQPFLAGNHRGFADVAIAPFVRQFRIADETWFDNAPYPKVHLWLQGFLNSSLFQRIMRKYKLWKDTSQEYNFPEAP